MLSKMLGIQLNPANNTGNEALKELSEKYFEECTYEDGVVSFETDLILFEVHTDEDERGKVVFSATATTYAPKLVLFTTAWNASLGKTMSALKREIAKLEIMEEIEEEVDKD